MCLIGDHVLAANMASTMPFRCQAKAKRVRAIHMPNQPEVDYASDVSNR